MNLHDLIQIKADVIGVTEYIKQNTKGLEGERLKQWNNITDVLERALHIIGELQGDNEAINSQYRKETLAHSKLKVEFDKLQRDFQQLKQLI
jgi:hypothetical protein